MIIDSHIHVNINEGIGIGYDINSSDESPIFQRMIKERKLGILANSSSAEEYQALRKISGAFVSFGIHPWQVDDFMGSADADRDIAGCTRANTDTNTNTNTDTDTGFEAWFNQNISFYEGADAVGEIGMDSVWCQCDLTLQRKIFEKQLNIAQSLGKPVVLHTKGMEGEIFRILRGYSMTKLVHWYSCDKYLDEFIAQDCYFTVGPNFKNSVSIQELIKKVPLNRLLVETDGIQAVEWAVGQKITADEIPAFLLETVVSIAEIKGISVQKAEAVTEENFYRLIGCR